MSGGGQFTSYGYDGAGRLFSETSPAQTYGLDAVGNRLSKTGTTNYSYLYNQNDWLTSVGGGTSLLYGYDNNGALSTATFGGVTTTLSYDFEGRLVQSGTTRFTYDAEGNRLSQTTGFGTASPQTTFYLQDPSSGLAEVVEEYNSAGTTQATYDYAGSELVREDRGGSAYYAHLDSLGSVRALSDASGNVVASYTYDAFGNLQNSGTLSAIGQANPYRYTGAAFDVSTGLYFLRARFYDPQAGRFLSHDPLLGNDDDPITQHRYLYAGADPANNIDPTGTESLGEVMSSLSASFALNVRTATVATIARKWILDKLLLLTLVGGVSVSKRWGSPIKRQVLPRICLSPTLLTV